MIKNSDIICISSIDWDFIWQGHQEIMSAFAKNGNRILFIENTGVRTPTLRDMSRLNKRLKNYFKGIKGIREESDNLYIFSPVILPFPYSTIARLFNSWILFSFLKRWLRIMDFADPIIFTFLPTGTTLDLISKINNSLVVYYCIDNFAASSVSVRKIRRTEKKLIEAADIVFVTSRTLYDYCFERNKNTVLFPFGVNIRNFEKIRIANTQMPESLKDIKKPIIGYIGGIHKWIDLSLVKEAAMKRPMYSFVFIGPIQTDISKLSELKNVFFLGSKEHQELPLYLKYFSATLIPYLITDYTKNVYPTKLNEYLAMGKPVISTALLEILCFNRENGDVVYVANNAEDFCEKIDESLQENSETMLNLRLKIAASNEWAIKIEQMSVLMEKTIKAKIMNKEEHWKGSILMFYRKSQQKFIRLILVSLIIYLFIFYTPIVWFLARPLKIQDYPRKADVIVVFAGGLGESGKWGQGYEERVQYAAELYESGYAKSMIFSSGYTYMFKETQVMKALAVSLGVPESAILLEDRAVRTYENVKNTSEILKKNGWEKILLVSSPYHMRRVKFVFNKVAPSIDVLYTPVPKSIFYEHSWGTVSGRRIWQKINMRQIKGIIREYLGVMYYWFKGWI